MNIILGQRETILFPGGDRILMGEQTNTRQIARSVNNYCEVFITHVISGITDGYLVGGPEVGFEVESAVGAQI